MRSKFPALILLFCYSVFLWFNICAYAGGADSSGYLNLAKLITSGKLQEKQRIIDGVEGEISEFAYVPLGFKPANKDGYLDSFYPIGFPSLIALLSLFVGIDIAAHLVIWLHAIGSLVLIYYFALELRFERFWALIAAVLLAINPLFLSYSLQLMSDMPSLFWCSLAIFAALNPNPSLELPRSRYLSQDSEGSTLRFRSSLYERYTFGAVLGSNLQNPGLAQDRGSSNDGFGLKNDQKKWAIICGIATGIAVLIRPTNVLIFAPLLVAFGKNWRGLFLCGCSGLPFAAILLITNYLSYGQFFATSYPDLSDKFGSEFIPFSIEAYARYLPLVLTPFVVFLVSIFVPSIWRQSKKPQWVFAVWILSFLTFYAFYYFTHTTWWYTRFLLPSFMAMILAILMVVRAVASLKIRFSRSFAIFFVLFSFFWQLSVIQMLRIISQSESLVYFEITSWVNNNLPADSAIIAMQDSGAIFFYTDLPIIRYDILSKDELVKIANTLQKKCRSIYAILHSHEVEAAPVDLFSKLPGNWQKIHQINQIEVWKFD
jgi:hypothetical protein